MMRASVKLDEIEGLDVLGKSIAPEAATEMPRTEITVRQTGDVLANGIDETRGLEIIIDAEDASSLRAALNSYLRWLDLAMKTREMTMEKEGAGKPLP